MEASCSIASLKSGYSTPRVTVWDGGKLSRLSPQEKEDMKKIIDGMGRLSAIAQRLRLPITDYERIHIGTHRLYLLSSSGSSRDTILVKGLLKVGHKNLFIRKECGALVEINPLCVLDFYVHVSCQRIGLGRQIFDAMLSNEKKLPHQMGYDRPSPKLISFLGKHYHLKRFYPQANQFVIYNAYFDSTCRDKMKVQSRQCDCIKGDQKTCIVALLDEESPRKSKEVLHGRRASRSSTHLPLNTTTTSKQEDAPPTTPLKHHHNQNHKGGISQIFPREAHPFYDWMTGSKTPFLLQPTPDWIDRRESPEAANLRSDRSSSYRNRDLDSSTVAYDDSSARLPQRREEVKSSISRGDDDDTRKQDQNLSTAAAQNPRSSLRAHLSGFGAAAALGFKSSNG